jgi:hypothetical protein
MKLNQVMKKLNVIDMIVLEQRVTYLNLKLETFSLNIAKIGKEKSKNYQK